MEATVSYFFMLFVFVNYNCIDTNNNLDVHKYLMKKNRI